MVNKPNENGEHPKRAKIGAILALTSVLAGAAACDTQPNEQSEPTPAPEVQKENQKDTKENQAEKQAEPNKVAESDNIYADFDSLVSFLEDKKHDPKLELEKFEKIKGLRVHFGDPYMFRLIKTEEGQLAFLEKFVYSPDSKDNLLKHALSDKVKKSIKYLDLAYLSMSDSASDDLADLMKNELVSVSSYYDSKRHRFFSNEAEVSDKEELHNKYLEKLFKTKDEIFVGPLSKIKPNDITGLTRFIAGSKGNLQLEAIKKCKNGTMDARLLDFIYTEEGVEAFMEKIKLDKKALEYLADL